MADLSDEELTAEIRVLEDMPQSGRVTNALSFLRELQRHRSALAADKERVRSAVRNVIATVTDLNGQHYAQSEIEDIATRAAEQLALPARPVASPDDIRQVRSFLANYRAGYATSCSIIDRWIEQLSGWPAGPVLSVEEWRLIEGLLSFALVGDRIRAALTKLLRHHGVLP